MQEQFHLFRFLQEIFGKKRKKFVENSPKMLKYVLLRRFFSTIIELVS